MRVWKILILVFGVIFISQGPSGSELAAAINPQELRKGHPECILISVVATSYIDCPKEAPHLTLAAEVIEVFWSATQLQAGDFILIRYAPYVADRSEGRAIMRANYGMVGPQQLTAPEALAVGERKIAHLAIFSTEDASGPVYEPKAHDFSFEDESSKHKYVK